MAERALLKTLARHEVVSSRRFAIEKPSHKLLAVAKLNSDTWVGEVKRIRGKKLPLTAAGFTDQTFSI